MVAGGGVVKRLFRQRCRRVYPTSSVTWSDGPFVVTHLILGGREVASEGDKAVAQLSRPIAIIDSRGASLSPEEVSRLTWRGISGHRVSPPAEGSPIHALYYRPLRTPPAGP